jgi:hypothetical protein
MSSHGVGVEVLHSCHASTGKTATPLIINTTTTTSCNNMSTSSTGNCSRIRPRAARETSTTTATTNSSSIINQYIDEFPKAYRLEHSVEKTGRIISSSKKRIMWYVARKKNGEWKIDLSLSSAMLLRILSSSHASTRVALPCLLLLRCVVFLFRHGLFRHGPPTTDDPPRLWATPRSRTILGFSRKKTYRTSPLNFSNQNVICGFE